MYPNLKNISKMNKTQFYYPNHCQFIEKRDLAMARNESHYFINEKRFSKSILTKNNFENSKSKENEKLASNQPMRIKIGVTSSLGGKSPIINEEFCTKNLLSGRYEKLLKLKKYRPSMSREKRKKILSNYPFLARLFFCNSKINLIRLFYDMPIIYKNLLRLYLEKIFILHLHLRQLKDFSKLMIQRHSIYKAIDDPEILKGNMNFANNLVKNFCKGVLNFIVIFYEDLKNLELLPAIGKHATLEI